MTEYVQNYNTILQESPCLIQYAAWFLKKYVSQYVVLIVS